MHVLVVVSEPVLKSLVRKRKRDRRFADPLNVHKTFKVGLFSCFRHRENRNKCAAFEALVELHIAFGNGENRMIFALADTFAWPEFIAALTHDDVAGDHRLTAIQLYTKTTTR